MARTVPELRMRQFTDRRMSFLWYVLVVLAMAAVAIIGSLVAGLGATMGAGMAPSIGVTTVGSAAVGVVAWWYQWRLFRRRNDHFNRIRRLKHRLAMFLEQEMTLDVDILRRPEPLLDRREKYHSPLIFALWLVFSYAGWLMVVHWSFALLSVVGAVLGLVVYYWLTVDYYFHERGEIEYFGKVAGLLEQRSYRLQPQPMLYLPQRRFGLYILFSIITFGIFTIYWMYVLFRDPNQHFDTHDFWEGQLEDILRRYRREREQEDTQM
jgi:hypothetical protein